VRLATPQDSHKLGEQLANLARPGDVIALSGPLGAGKTSIARGLLAGLGLEAEAPSPSFAIVQPYAPPETRIPVLHTDLYRIDDPSEADELGLDEARWDSLLIVEWPERLGASAWADALWLTLSPHEGGGRALTAVVPAAWEGRWPPT
jgi:tRNA threonylcarbamoyladenosine biosynthesis protein TsaE